jgi:ribonuclease HIII
LKIDSKSAHSYEVLVIHEKSEIEYNKLMEFFEEQMIKLKNKVYNMIQELKNVDNMTKCDYQGIVDKKINKIWSLWQTNVIDKFAQLNYGYAITVHKSQGSTFRNVFVDISDIFDNQNKKETLKCLYTAITRSSETLELLI